MKQATKYIYKLALFLTLFFLMAFAMSYLSDYLQTTGFFGDKHLGMGLDWHTGKPIQLTDGAIDLYNEWGPRHYIFFCFRFTLKLLSLSLIAVWTYQYWNKIEN
jgi:hypothetical protein